MPGGIGTAWAARCGGYADTLIAWCDDFDNYCTALNPTDPWPGYPPAVEVKCATDETAVADEAWFRQHWPKMCTGEGNASMVPQTSAITGGIAWSMPMVATYQGGTNSSQYHEWDMTQAIADRHTGMNAVNGTDTNPLQLRYYYASTAGVGGAVNNSPAYIELRLGDGRAPTDWVPKNCYIIYDCNCADLHYHSCDCYNLHPDIPCNCDNLHPTIPCNCDNLHPGDPLCGTGETATCQGGPTPGATCSDFDPGNLTAPSIECSSPCGTGEETSAKYNGGPRNGQTCTEYNPSDPTGSSLYCSSPCATGEVTSATCHGGPRNNENCYVQDDPDGFCSGWCLPEEEEYKTCWDGEHDGEPCENDSPDCDTLRATFPVVNQQHLNANITAPRAPLDTTVVYPPWRSASSPRSTASRATWRMAASPPPTTCPCSTGTTGTTRG